MDITIRRRTDDELEALAYEQAQDEVLAEMRAEWEAEFGGNPAFPFKPDGRQVHKLALAKLEAQRENA